MTNHYGYRLYLIVQNQVFSSARSILQRKHLFGFENSSLEQTSRLDFFIPSILLSVFFEKKGLVMSFCPSDGFGQVTDLTLTRSIGLPPNTPVAQKIEDQH